MTAEPKSPADLQAALEALRRKLPRFQALREENRRLHQSLERLTDLLAGTRDLVSTVDLEGRFLYLNHRSQEIFGLPPDQCLGLSAFDFIHPEDRERTRKWFADLISDRSPAPEIENRLISRSGQICHMLWTARVHYDSQGHPQQIQGFAQDITRYKLAEGALKEEKERYNRLLHQARVGLFRSRLADGRLISCNEYFARRNGYASVEECLAEYDARGHFNDRESGERLIRRLREFGEVLDYEIEVTTKDGTPVWVSFSAKAYREEGYLEVATVSIADRKNTQLDLQKSEANLRAIFDSSPQVFILLDREGRIQAFNPTAEKLTGSLLNRELREGLRFRTIIPPDCLEIYDQYFQSALEGIPGSVELEILDPQDRGHWFHFDLAPIFGLDGQVIGVYYNAIDIQDRKEAEQALRDSEERYRLLLNNANDAVYVHDVSPETPGAFGEVNDRACQMLGYTRQELLRLKVTDIDVPEQEENVPRILGQLFTTGKAVFQTEHLAKDGRRLPVEISTRLFDLQGKPAVLSVVRDITERRQAEEALRVSEERFRQLAENIRDVFWVGSPDWQEFYYVSPAYQELWGRPPQNLYEDPNSWLEAIPEEDRRTIKEALREKIKGNLSNPEFPEYRIVRPDGRTAWAKTRAYPVRDDRGQIVRIVGVVEDITERRLAQERLTNSLREKDLLFRKLLESENRYRRLVENAPALIFRLSLPHRRYEYISPLVEEFSGYAPPFFFDNPDMIRTIVPPAWKSSFDLHWEASLEGEESGSFEYPIIHLHSGLRWWRQRNIQIRDADGRRIAVEGLILDITDEKERRLEFESIIRSSLDGFWVADVPQATLLEVNDAYCRMSGYSREELQGQTISLVEARETPEETARHIQELVKKGYDRFETRHRCRDGRIIDVEISMVCPLLGQKIYCFIRDVTERNRFLSDLSQKKRHLQELTFRLSEIVEAERKAMSRELHDQIGQNLTALGINLNILKGGLSCPSSEAFRNRLQDSIDLVDQTTQQLRSLITQFRPPDLDDFGLVSALHGLADPFEKRTGIPVEIRGEELSPRPPGQVENNLFRITQEALNNVAKHARAQKVTIEIQSRENFLQLSIRDDGVGFDQEPVERNGRGDRLGLISMGERALALGGDCRIKSQPGQGTTVLVEVPW